MADTENEDDRYKNVDVDSILSRVERRPLTLTRKRSLCQAPEFLKRLSGEDEIEEGGNLRLECRIVGFPKPTLRWFRDDEEITENERYTYETLEDNWYTINIPLVSKCDEASYRCKAENKEGGASSLLYVHIKGKSGSKSPKKSKSQSPSRRTVSFPPLIPTIVERIVEEEKAQAELETLPPSPLTSLYDGVTMKQKNTRPQFLGDWAFVKDVVNSNHTGVLIDADVDDDDDMVFLVTDREGDLHDSSSDDNKSESGSPDERKPEEVSLASAIGASDPFVSPKMEESLETVLQSEKSEKTKHQTVDVNRNSTETKCKSKAKVKQVDPPQNAPPITPPSATLPSPVVDSDIPRSSNRPLFTRRMKPKKLIVRKRQTPSAQSLCSSWDYGILFLLVSFVTFVSLCVELDPGRFLPMIFSGYVIYTFVMALLSDESSTRETT